MLEEMIAGVYTSQEVNMDDFNRRLDEIYYPLDIQISWVHKCIENLGERLDQDNEIVNVVDGNTAVDHLPITLTPTKNSSGNQTYF
ncbi:hypothetical protein F2Q70_00038935 [Brassica cretica]|uniref:Uncharacterized protein n=1 Tax=Brassica cretica TaxID=69181 RepID=A0A8S9K2D1_BRACR|nr:hypothetical protein F2Q70_00038935 [Brassica cretica]